MVEQSNPQNDVKWYKWTRLAMNANDPFPKDMRRLLEAADRARTI